MVWLIGDLCVVANVGDAKAVLARQPAADSSQQTAPNAPSSSGGTTAAAAAAASAPPPLKALTLTKEHLAIHSGERQRITASGGFVSQDGRLNGRMQVREICRGAEEEAVCCQHDRWQ